VDLIIALYGTVVGEQVQRKLEKGVVWRGDILRGERGSGGGRVQEAGEEEGFEQRGESRLALQGRTIRILALFHREARRLLQSRRARLAQLARPSRQLLPLRPRLRRHPRLRRRNRRRCHHSR